MQARARSVHVRDEGLHYGHVPPSISRRHQAFESAQSAEQARKSRSCFNIDNCRRHRRMVGRQRRRVLCGSRGRRFPRPRSVRRAELTSGRVNCQDPLESMHHRFSSPNPYPGCPYSVTLAAAILTEKDAGSSSRWAQYVASLP